MDAALNHHFHYVFVFTLILRMRQARTILPRAKKANLDGRKERTDPKMAKSISPCFSSARKKQDSKIVTSKIFGLSHAIATIFFGQNSLKSVWNVERGREKIERKWKTGWHSAWPVLCANCMYVWQPRRWVIAKSNRPMWEPSKTCTMRLQRGD